MTKYNAANERIKRRYLKWEKEANRKSNSTVTNIQNYLYLYEEYTSFKSFKLFNKKDAINFKKHLTQKKSKQTGTSVSKTYMLHATRSLKDFFKWLYDQPGYKRNLRVTDIEYFNLSAKDVQIARSAPSKRYPTVEQIEHAVKNMPSETEVQKRDRALVCFLALTGARVSAIGSIRLKHVFLQDERIEQHPQEVKTKNSKKIITYLFPVGDYLKSIFIDWVHFLTHEKLFDHDTPLFPSTKLTLDKNDQFSRQELDTTAWKSTTSIRTIVKEAFITAGLDYYNPHSFRNTIVQLGYRYCKTPEEFKAWSQNLGHNTPLITFTSYGSIDEFNQGEIIKRLGNNKNREISEELTVEEIKIIKKVLSQA